MCNKVKTIFCYQGRVLDLALVLAVLIPTSAAASDPPEPLSTFSQRLDLIQVEVDLVVTDGKGRPVRDLERSDLELYRDGTRQEILYFGKPSDHRPAARSRHLIIYVDNLRIWPKRRNLLLRRLGGSGGGQTKGFIEQRIARGDRFSVAAFDGSVELLIVDSRDAEQILACLEALESRPSAMAQVVWQGHHLRRDLAEGIVGGSVLRPRIERHVARLRLDVARSLAGLTATVRALARPSRSTSVLYLSDGIPAWPGDEFSGPAAAAEPRVLISAGTGARDDTTPQAVPTPVVQYLVSSPRSRQGSSLAAESGSTAEFLEPLITAANTHGVAFYPVRPSAFFHPLIHDSRAGGRSRADHIGPLRRLAESTGGDFVSYGRFEAALARLSRRLDSAYTLGFQISPKSGEAPHTLEVQLARKGLRAHYRRGYVLDLRAGAD